MIKSNLDVSLLLIAAWRGAPPHSPLHREDGGGVATAGGKLGHHNFLGGLDMERNLTDWGEVADPIIVGFIGTINPGVGEEVLVRPGGKRETFRQTLANVEDELGMLPHRKLAMVYVERAATDLTEKDVLVTQH